MSFNPITNPVDFVVIAGKRSPGIATITGFRRPLIWTKRMSFGMSGATAIYRGCPLISGKLVLLFTTSEELDAWSSFRTLFEPLPPVPATQTDAIFVRQRGRILDIVHPQLADLGIRRVFCEEDGQLEPEGEDGRWTVEIALTEHRPPVLTLQHPRGTVAAAPVLDARDQTIADLTSQIQANNLAAEVPQ